MITIERQPSFTLVAPTGRLDSQTTPACEAQIMGLVTAETGLMILDLKDLVYVASLGLRMILLVAKRMKHANGRLHICNLQPQVREVFDVSGFAAILPVFDSREQALAAASPRP